MSLRNWLKVRNSDYSDQKKDLELAISYYEKNKIEDSEEIVNSILQRKKIFPEILISCLLLQSKMLLRTGKDFKLSQEKAKKAVLLSEKENNLKLLLESYLILCSTFLIYGIPTNDLSDLIDKIDDAYNKFIINNNKELDTIGSYYKVKAMYFGNLGKFDLAIEFFLKSSEINERMDKIHQQLMDRENVSLCYQKMGDFQKAIDSEFDLIEIINKKNDKSLENILLRAYANIGRIYRSQGELEKGFEFLNKSLDLSISTLNFDYKALCLEQIGLIYLMKGDLNSASHNMKLSLDVYKQIGNEISEISLLVDLLKISIFNKDNEKQDFYSSQIQELANKHAEDDYFKTCLSFSKALILKEKGQTSDKIEARNLFHEVIKKEYFIDDEIFSESLLNYLDSLIEELKETSNDVILKEIETTNKHLIELAKQHFSYVLMVESMVIDAKVSIINLNFDHARQVLTQAQISAEEKGLKLLTQKISKEHDNLLTKMTQKGNIENSNISERLELAEIEDVLKSFIRSTYSVNSEDEEHDFGIILLIVNSAGIAMFSRKFIAETQIEDQLFASLLTAMNAFSKETFNTEEPIDRIKQGENTIIIKKFYNFNICYAFKGPTYFASKKINSFMSKINESDQILQKLKNYETKIPRDTIENLNLFVDEIFVT